MITIAVLLTVFNRREKTIECLERLFAQQLPGVHLDVTLLDDASSDGTAQAVRSSYPQVNVLEGTGNAYWNGGMRAAWQAAAHNDPDYYLWLNDDTVLDRDALQRLLNTSAFFAEQAIIVGTTRDPDTQQPTYGGVRRTNPAKPLHFSLVQPTTAPQPADTMNGNCVLIPREIYQKAGMLSPDFTHSIGDFDYGLRVRQQGGEIWIAPGTIGTCARNAVHGSWQDATLPKRARMQKLMSVKGLPPREWREFARRHTGPAWPLFWASPYVRTLLTSEREGQSAAPLSATSNREHIIRTAINLTSYAKAAQDIVVWAGQHQNRRVHAANVHMVMEAYDSAAFQDVVNTADLNTPDGMPLVWGLKLLGHSEATRVYGPTLMLHICEAAAKAGTPIGLYGGTDESLQAFESFLDRKFPGIQLVYSYAPPFRALSTEEDQQVVRDILASGAQILFVGIGCPKQERWMYEHRESLPLVMLGVGAAFDFHTGRVRQAPDVMQRFGLEWLFRLAMEPKRLWKRYAKHNPRFVMLFGLQLLRRRLKGGQSK